MAKSKAAATREPAREPEVLPAVATPTDPDVQLVQQLGEGVVGFIKNVGQFIARARDLEQTAQDMERQARSLVVSDAESHAACKRIVIQAREHKKTIAEHWTISQVLHRVHKMTTTRRGVGETAAANAEALGTQKFTRYDEEQKRREEEDRRRREEEERARIERERQAEQAKAEIEALAAEQNAPTLSKREDIFCDEMVAHGDQVRAAKVAGYKNPREESAKLLSLGKINAAIEARETAKQIRQQAAAKAAEPIYIEEPIEEAPPERAKATTVTTYSAEVTNVAEAVGEVLKGVIEVALLEAGVKSSLIDGVAQGIVTRIMSGRTSTMGLPVKLLTISQGAATELAKSIGPELNRYKGIRCKETKTVR